MISTLWKLPGLMLVLLLLTAPGIQAVSDDYQRGVQAFEQKNYRLALRLLTPVARNGNVDAQYRVGRIYEKGYIGRRDNAKMVYWYRLAAAGNHGKAQYKLAVGYARGLAGLRRDEKRGAQYLIRSANNGYRRAMKVLARAYKAGKYGLPRDKGKARHWSRRYEQTK